MQQKVAPECFFPRELRCVQLSSSAMSERKPDMVHVIYILHYYHIIIDTESAERERKANDGRNAVVIHILREVFS